MLFGLHYLRLPWIILALTSSNASAFARNPSSSVAAPPTPSSFGKSSAADHQPTPIKRQRRFVSAVQRKMGSQALVYGTAVGATFGLQTIGFVAAWVLKTEKFFDIIGGANYLLVSCT